MISRQARDAGLALPIVVSSPSYSPKFIELGGAGVEGVYTLSPFFPDDPRPAVQSFVRRFRAKYDQEPDTFNAGAYDTMILFTRLVAGYGATRDAMQTGLLQIKDVPSVIYGTVSFDPLTRRVPNARYKHLIVKEGKFALWDDKRPT